MVAGDTTIQEILEGLAEEVDKIPGVKESFANHRNKIGQTPAVVFSWSGDNPTTIEHGSTQLWGINAKAVLYGAPLKGNDPNPDMTEYQNLIHPIVDVISRHPQTYDYGTKMANLPGVHRIEVVGIRPAQFALQYAGHKYYGAELYLNIKLHRKVSR